MFLECLVAIAAEEVCVHLGALGRVKNVASARHSGVGQVRVSYTFVLVSVCVYDGSVLSLSLQGQFSK